MNDFFIKKRGFRPFLFKPIEFLHVFVDNCFCFMLYRVNHIIFNKYIFKRFKNMLCQYSRLDCRQFQLIFFLIGI